MSGVGESLPPELSRQQVVLPDGVRSAAAARSASASLRASGQVLQQAGLSKRFPDGRQCKLCNCSDSDWDPLDREPVYMWWGYLPDAQGCTRGDVCYYCVRVHLGRYKHKWSITALIEKVGGSADELKKFKAFRKLAIEVIQEKGVRDIRCPWQDFERTLEFEERATMSIMYPEEEFLPMDEYFQEFGNPGNNGHNHAPFTLDGKSGMLVPTGKRVRLQRKKEQSVIKKNSRR